MLDLAKALYYMEDFKLFKKVQLNKYRKNSKRNISNSPELDMVVDLIKEYWCDLLSSGYLNNKSIDEKKKIYQSVEIIFPYYKIPSKWTDGITYVNFGSYWLIN